MKRIIAVMVVAVMMFSVIAGCKNETKNETTTSVLPTHLHTEKETEITTEMTSVEEETTERPIEYIKSGKIEIDDGEYKYTLEKKAFEDNYSEEFLMGLSSFFVMDFGYEDYDNWNGETNDVLNDLIINGRIWFDSFEYNSSEWNKAVTEMNKNPYKGGCSEYGFTTIDNINIGIKERFGPDAREFKAEDFDTYNELKTSDASVFENNDFNYIFAYLPESDCVVFFTNEFLEGGLSVFVCDVQTVNDCYVVETVMGSEHFFENGYTFEGRQIDALRMFNSYTYGRLFKNVFTIAVDENGNLYMKSVDKSYILPENVKANYKVNQDNVKVEAQKYYSSEWETVDTLSKDEEVYSGTMYWLYEDYVWISTEEYEGRVERKYLTPIE